MQIPTSTHRQPPGCGEDHRMVPDIPEADGEIWETGP